MERERAKPAKLVGEALWRRHDATSLEHCRVTLTEDMHVVQGCIVALMDSQPCQVHYAISCHPDWSTRSVHVGMAMGETMYALQLRRDEAGEWWRDDERLSEFHGIADVDLSISPATNTLPIRRMKLHHGESASADALWVRFPGLALERLPQRYTRIDEHRFTYESRGGAFTADLEVDGQGLMVRYGEIWERVTS